MSAISRSSTYRGFVIQLPSEEVGHTQGKYVGFARAGTGGEENGGGVGLDGLELGRVVVG